MNNNLSLKNAYEKISEFEQELQMQIPLISRIISNIEVKDVKLESSSADVKGYHIFEFWEISDFCIIELQIFFDGNINISEIYSDTSELEGLINHSIIIDGLKEFIIHAEPIEGRSKENIF